MTQEINMMKPEEEIQFQILQAHREKEMHFDEGRRLNSKLSGRLGKINGRDRKSLSFRPERPARKLLRISQPEKRNN